MNRTPSLTLNSKSPFEILYDNIPNYANFKVFYSFRYASILLSSRHKFTPRQMAAIMILDSTKKLHQTRLRPVERDRLALIST